MANISDIVSRSFEGSRDFRLTYDVSEKGAANLLSGIYSRKDAIDRKFYKKPELAEGEEVKLAILYGEIMITPYIIDVGSSTGTQDPASIRRTIRFIAGDGVTEGVVVGPNGSQLENVYMGGTDKEVPQPVVSQDGRPTTKDVIIAGALGGAITSAPKIWDLISSAVSGDDTVTDIDPVTGGPIKTVAEQIQEATLGQNLRLEGLSDVSVGNKSSGYVLAFDNATQKWVATPISDLLDGTVSVTGGSGGSGGDGGQGGQGGKGGNGSSGQPFECVDDSPVCETPEPFPTPDTSLQKPPTTVKSGSQLNMVELLDYSQTKDNEYRQNVDITNTKGISLHFFFEGLGLDNKWAKANEKDPDSKMPCLTNENTTNMSKIATSIAEPGSVKLDICLSVEVCGFDYNIFEMTYSEGGSSVTSFTRHTNDILWTDTDLMKLKPYWKQMFPDGRGNIIMRVRRMDGEESGKPLSNYPVFFQGLTFLTGTILNDITTPEKVDYPVLKPSTANSMVDDGRTPDRGPTGSGLGPDTCPPKSDLPTTSPGEPGAQGSAGQPAQGGQPGSTGTGTIGTGVPSPSVVLNKPANVAYCKDQGATTFPAVTLGTINSVESNSASPQVTVTYTMVTGLATFKTSGTPPGVTVSGIGTNTLTLIGLETAMPTASGFVQIQPDPTATGNLQYKIGVTNSEGGQTGVIASATSCAQSIANSSPACAFVTLQSATTATGSTAIYAEMPNNTTTQSTVIKQLTSAPVSKTNGQTVEAHASAVAANINANVASKNALAAGSANWLPKYVATAQGAKVTVCGPTGGGSVFNSLELDARFTGGVSDSPFDSFMNFVGGVSKNVSDFVTENPFWGVVGETLLGIGGNILGAVVTNVLMNNNSSLEISIPESDKDVTVTFLYRGRKVNVPAEYDAFNRVGSPSYSNWSGNWKTVWTDNPAWCLLDYIDNRKFGLGDDIVMTAAQRELMLQDIFSISQYCDELTSENEPRFSLNTAITDGTKIEILEQLCSVFFGSYCWHKGGLRIRADRPDTEVKLLVNQSNADELVYEHTTLRSFYNKVEVIYVEPSSFYTQESVKVENTQGVEKYGEKAVSVVGFGITDSDQALRYANWMLQSEIENGLIVTYRAGWDHYRLVPGDIVQFEDSGDRGKRLAGRVRSAAGTNVVTDGPVEVLPGYGFSVTLEDGTIFATEIASVISPTNFTLVDSIIGTVLPFSTFITSDLNVGPQLFRVLKIDEISDGNYNTTLQLYSIDKYSKITATTRAIA